MRRLMLSRSRSATSRTNTERGAIAVTAALVMVAMIGFTALAVDIGSLWWDRKQLQNGADAAALALAQSCAKGSCEADEATMGTGYVQGNKNDGNAALTAIEHTGNSVTVSVSSTRQHWFAPILGQSSSTVSATSTVSWGAIGAAAVLPLTVSICQLAQIRSGEEVVLRLKDELTDCAAGNPPHVIPGGFGWLVPGPDCKTQTRADSWVDSLTGNSGPQDDACNAYLQSLAGRDALVPVYDDAVGTGSHGQFHLAGYAALRVTSYCLAQGKGWDHTPDEKCTGSSRWIKGTFVKLVELGGTISPAPDFGVTTAQLTA